MDQVTKNDEFLRKLYPLIRDYEGQLPNLRDIFRPEAVEWLLRESIRQYVDRNNLNNPLIRFVINTGYKDEPKVDQNGKIIVHRTTPIHLAATLFPCSEVLDDLFQIYDRFDVNYTDDDGDGVTHFDVACRYGLYDVVEKFLELGLDPNVLVPKIGHTPLTRALIYEDKQLIELLLKYRADPNVANDEGKTSLHIICQRYKDGDDLAEFFFKVNEKINRTVEIDAKDKLGNAPLHLALRTGNKYKLVEWLLRRGADSNLANAEGLTPLHIICYRIEDADGLAEFFFIMNKKIKRTVGINAKDKLGNTPLHLAVSTGNKYNLVECLLRRGADPNSANAKGSTPLHIICHRYGDGESLAEFFFKINEKINRTVEIHAKDKLGRTPLQLAVLSRAAKTLDVLLKYGADLSSFVFPSESYFARNLDPSSSKMFVHPRYIGVNRLRCGSRALIMVDILENRGYKLNRDDALKIMGFFTKYRFYYEPMNLDTSWYDDEEFANKAKEMMMKPNLSLYDLVKLRPEEAEKNLTYSDYSDFACSYNWFVLPYKYIQACTAHLCETMSRGFFRRWALDSFSELPLNGLPIEGRELITNGTYTNKDLHDICLTAASLSS